MYTTFRCQRQLDHVYNNTEKILVKRCIYFYVYFFNKVLMHFKILVVFAFILYIFMYLYI